MEMLIVLHRTFFYRVRASQYFYVSFDLPNIVSIKEILSFFQFYLWSTLSLQLSTSISHKSLCQECARNSGSNNLTAHFILHIMHNNLERTSLSPAVQEHCYLAAEKRQQLLWLHRLLRSQKTGGDSLDVSRYNQLRSQLDAQLQQLVSLGASATGSGSGSSDAASAGAEKQGTHHHHRSA